MSGRAPGFDVFRPYVPRTLRRRLAADPDPLVESLDATSLFADISGFTALSERLAKRGEEGAELLAEAINSCFAALLADSYAYGGSLLKFGGDALLIMFDGEDHAARACAAAARMRDTLRRVGRLEVGASTITLRISMGVHTGSWPMFLVGGSHRELILDGPATTAITNAEGAASAGQIVLTSATAAALPRQCVGRPIGPGRLLRAAPDIPTLNEPEPLWKLDPELVARCLPTTVREYVRTGPHPPEHRRVAIGFVNYRGTDDLVEQAGLEATASELDALIRDVQEAVDEYRVTFLAHDIAGNGGKFILVGGAPTSVGDHCERMLIALRQILDKPRTLQTRAGVTMASVFTGEIGAAFRRTYTIMGDGVNLSARLMASAPFGSLYASLPVIEDSRATFRVTPLEPFLVKGKAKPVDAVAVGPVVRSADTHAARTTPLVGRDAELAAVRAAVEEAKQGRGVLIEIVGEGGSGKSRLQDETRLLLPDAKLMPVSGEAYTSSTPYAVMRDLCRQFLDVAWDAPDEVVLPALLAAADPDLHSWLPLLAPVIGVEMPSTPEVDALSAEHRQKKLADVMLRLLVRWTDAGLLIHIQRAHLVDAASAALMTSLVEFVSSTNWVVVSTRPFAEAGFVAPSGVRLELEPLGEDVLFQLADSFTERTPLPPHSVAEAVARCGGNPEFLLDLLTFAARSDGAELPQDVMAVATLQIDELEPHDRRVVQLASVLGVKFRPADMTALIRDPAERPTADTWKRLDAIFVWDGDEYVFRRGLHRDAAYAALPFRVRRELHARVAADMLQRLLVSGEDIDESVLSMHHELAGDSAAAFAHALSAARNAAASFSYADAATLYERAIAAARAAGIGGPRLADAWEEVASAYERTGEPVDAHFALSQARRLMRDDPLATGRLLLAHARLAESTGDIRAAARWANRGVGDLEGRQGADSLLAELRCVLATVRLRQGRFSLAETLCREVLADVTGGRAATARASVLLDWVLAESGRVDEAHYADVALAIYREDGDVQKEAATLNNMGGCAYWRGEMDEAIRLYRLAGDGCMRAGDDAGAMFADGNVGEVLLEQGRLDEAEELLRRARRLARGVGSDWTAHWFGVLLGRCLTLAGQHEEGLSLLAECTQELRRLGHAASDVERGEQFLAEAKAMAGQPV